MAGRMEAQARADRIRAFREELAALEKDMGGVLSDAERQRVTAHHDALLAELAHQYDVATTESGRQLALGLRLASFLGALALCTAVVLFVNRFWGALGTATQVALLILTTALALGLTEFAARREKTLYFAGLAAVVAFAAFVTNVSVLGQVFNLVSSHQAFLVWALFAGALAYGYGLRLLLLAALVTGTIWFSGTLATINGLYWTALFARPELLIPPAAVAIGIGVSARTGRHEGFPPIYRLSGLILLFWIVLWRATSGEGSVLPLAPEQVETVYQIFGFVASGLAIWAGIRRRWSDVTYAGVTAFTILLYIKAVDWWWDWMPRWLFFLVLGGIAVGVMVLLQRFKARTGGAR